MDTIAAIYYRVLFGIILASAWAGLVGIPRYVETIQTLQQISGALK